MTDDPPPKPPPGRTAVLVYRGIGILCVGLATAGVFLPLMPTTVFLLIALWAFAKGSPEWADRVRSHPRLGPFVRDWEERRAIPRPGSTEPVVVDRHRPRGGGGGGGVRGHGGFQQHHAL